MQLGMSLWEDQAMKCKQVGVSVVAFLLLAGPALAETARGVITKVDLNNKELTIRGKARGSGKGSFTFRLSDDARVMVAGQKGTAKDLHPGRRVRVQYDDQDNQRVITSIRVLGRTNAGGRPILGRVQDIAPDEGKITVRGKLAKGERRKEITLELPKDVKVTRAGKAYPLDNLQEGALVRVMYRERSGKRVAQAIQVIDAQALLSRMRDTMKKADGYLRMAEFYLDMMEKSRKPARKTEKDTDKNNDSNNDTDQE
jgi:hypothetical protein